MARIVVDLQDAERVTAVRCLLDFLGSPVKVETKAQLLLLRDCGKCGRDGFRAQGICEAFGYSGSVSSPYHP